MCRVASRTLGSCSFANMGAGVNRFHLPSVLLGLGIGLLLLPALELLLCIRGLVLARVDRLLRPPFRYRLL